MSPTDPRYAPSHPPRAESVGGKCKLRFHERDDPSGLNADHVERIRRVLTALQDARSPRNLDLPPAGDCTSSKGIVADNGACASLGIGESSFASLMARR